MFNPLEQFEVHVIIATHILGLYFRYTSISVYFLLAGAIIVFTYRLSLDHGKLIPTPIQYIYESLYMLVYDMCKQQIGIKSQEFFPILFTYFILILVLNLIGLTPFGFTITSHISFTFVLGFSAWFAITLIGIAKHKLQFLKLFLPSGAPIFLIPLLVVIEIVSYISRTFSLSIRLFANMMSGHTLLYILSSFVSKIAFMTGNGLFLSFPFTIIPALPIFLVVSLVSVLELGIAFLQAYVFVVLVCIYLNDSYNAGSH